MLISQLFVAKPAEIWLLNRLSNKIVLLKYSRGKQGGFARA